MNVYVIDKNTNEIVREFSNVINFDINSVEYLNNDCRGKIYCDIENEYVTDVIPDQESQSNAN